MPKTKPKDLGTRFETAVVRYMRAQTGDDRIERRALHGAKDMGDIHGLYSHGYSGIVECKAVRSIGAKMLEEFKEQTLDERGNADVDFALLVIKRFNHPIGDAYCWATIRDLTRICLGIELRGNLENIYDEIWVCMPLSTACALM